MPGPPAAALCTPLVVESLLRLQALNLLPAAWVKTHSQPAWLLCVFTIWHNQASDMLLLAGCCPGVLLQRAQSVCLCTSTAGAPSLGSSTYPAASA